MFKQVPLEKLKIRKLLRPDYPTHHIIDSFRECGLYDLTKHRIIVTSSLVVVDGNIRILALRELAETDPEFFKTLLPDGTITVCILGDNP